MKIEVRENGKAYIHTPYNPDFVRKIKQLGGAKWNANEKAWSIPEAMIDAAREIMLDVYGETDIAAAEKAKVKLIFKEETSQYTGPVCIFGRVIAKAYGRDSGAVPGEDAAFVKGSCTSGGGAKNWRTIIESGSEVILNNVVESMIDESSLPEGVEMEILSAVKLSRAALLEERERLEKRIAEINELLKEEGK